MENKNNVFFGISLLSIDWIILFVYIALETDI